MAGLFDTSTDNVGLHLRNIYAEGELSEGATAEDSSVVQTEGEQAIRRYHNRAIEAAEVIAPAGQAGKGDADGAGAGRGAVPGMGGGLRRK
jgi:hypothetical protein